MFPHVGESTRYLAGPDEHRAADINAAFADPSVDGIFCLHGGYGASRILPLLDYEAIQKNPKVLCGYSDITALLNAIHRLTGLVTFHGPVGSEVQTDYTLASFRKVMMTAQPAGRVAEAPAPKGPPKEIVSTRRTGSTSWSREREGPARRREHQRLLDARRNAVRARAQGPHPLPRRSGRGPVRIDRWLTQFLLTGKLSGLAGVALGKFSRCTPGDYKPSYNGFGQWTWQEVCKDRLGKLGIPVVANLVFGHVPDKATLPLGVMAELDGDAGTLTLLESAVR